MPYIELHACSAFSFLRGGSFPEQLAQTAAELKMPALALLDRNGVYGAQRFSVAARECGVRPIIGCDLGMADGTILPVLVENRTGYKNLCRLVTRMKMRAPKGKALEGALELDELRPGVAALRVAYPAAERLGGQVELMRHNEAGVVVQWRTHLSTVSNGHIFMYETLGTMMLLLLGCGVVATAILMGAPAVRLITNNPTKIAGLEAHGVSVVERVRHPRYNKTVQRTKRIYAHDELNDVRVGDRVRVQETRPLSKLKRWRIVEVLERAK